MTTIAVLGASGFIGRAIAQALHARGVGVRELPAPRLRSPARSVDELRRELVSPRVCKVVDELREHLAGSDRVVNAAGISASGAALDDVLVGADALLPAVVAAGRPAGCRLVHVSSAAVQGRRERLDETWATDPFSPYSTAKAWGEQMLRASHDTVVFRPTSVHGADRPVTRSLIRLLGSTWASVAGPGDRPTPQVLVDNVGDAVAEVTLSPETAPPIVLQPAEGLTTAELVRLVGGREPLHVPLVVARTLIRAAALAGHASGGLAATSRRVEILWFGQGQSPSWLDDRWVPPVGLDGWKRLRS